ncbi:MAG: type II toxin-antitoxin system prevent-host-death family antitoxin [Gammaproteobacteria bacterium]|nr:type II toxin-antitoxin system prevent-host-death family antitoxin [Gammaproteobacteria bacterium]
MDTSYSELRQNLKRMIDWTTDNHEPAFITSHKERKAVLISYDDYCSLEETAYLLKSPANAQRLLKAILDSKKSENIKKHGLIDE